MSDARKFLGYLTRERMERLCRNAGHAINANNGKCGLVEDVLCDVTTVCLAVIDELELKADLLAACEAMHRLLTQEYGTGVRNGYFPAVAPLLKQAADAIAKATGVAAPVSVPDVDSDADE